MSDDTNDCVIALVFSTTRRRWSNASRGVSCSSRIKRSTLFRTKHGLIFSVHAFLSTACVWVDTPSRTSITTNAPSQRRVAVDTSEEKSMCPGESMRLTK
jgi:hypothetical protein